jgi:neutral ceramidase
MTFKRIFRILVLSVLILVGLVLVFVAVSVAPTDRTKIEETRAFEVMKSQWEFLDSVGIPPATHSFLIGYGKVNLTPDHPIATAAYGKRKGRPYPSVHDSIFVRAMVIDNGSTKVAIVTADLLIIPPTVTEMLPSKLERIGFSLANTYLGATHTHNSIGKWGDGATQILYGTYDEKIVEFIADRIVKAIEQALGNSQPSRILTGTVAVPRAVDNRLTDEGQIDSLLRVVEVQRADSSKLLLMSYTAHATCLFAKDLELSRDYPGKLVDTIEENGYEFAMFMAGSVGSHGCRAPVMGWDCIDWMANEVATTFLTKRNSLHLAGDSSLQMIRIPLALSDPQIKVLPEWKVRSWLFRSALGEYPVFLTGLRLGDVVFLGIPGDFSGEFNAALDSVAVNNRVEIIPTSFNGGYIGYLTPRGRYERNHYETQLMNWYAPGTGEMVQQTLMEMIEALNKK